MRKTIFLIPILCFAALALLLYFGLRPEHGPGKIPSALIGKEVPDFQLPDFINGAPIRPEQFKGRPYIINYFASWCLPCRAEHPLLQEIGMRSGLPILGILYKDKREAAEAFLKELGNPYQAIAFDEDGRLGIEFGLYGIPETFIIDQEGKIIFRQAGPIDPGILEREILPLLHKLKS